jgi:superfamily I DNA and/or RNA helicase
LSFFPVEHSGCRQKSNEEAQATLDILSSLVGQRVIDRNGTERAMTLDDVLVVAPYNMQVNLLRSILPDGARVGTVDKFQGQEAEAVIVSMTTSGADDMPRDASFLLSRNRFNVAISRARCLAVVVASPGLLDFTAQSVDEMRLANLLCWAAEFSNEPSKHEYPRK